MLTRLRIRDFAIIDELDLQFEPGMCILTGETGAGKSIIIDAVELVLGSRADSAVVRTGADTAFIEAEFRLHSQVRDSVHKILDAEGLLDDPDFVMLVREVRAEGRNLCRINGRVVTLALMRQLGDLLVDVHGQSEHLSLLRVPEHLALLDRYAMASEALEEYQAMYASLRRLRNELEALERRERDAAHREEMLRFQINEIEAAALKPGEEAELLQERDRVANAEQLANLSQQAIAALEEGLRGQIATSDLLGQAVDAIRELAEVDASMSELGQQAQALLEQVTELSRQLRIYQEDIDFDPRRLDEVEERIGLLRDLSRKYGGSVEAVMASLADARRALQDISHAGERLEALRAEEGEGLRRLAELGGKLSEIRQEAAVRLAQSVEAELVDLNMAGARFEVGLTSKADPDGLPLNGQTLAYGPDGLDHVEFLVAPNPGEGLKPLVKIASGGETSRLMLGLKGVLAEADRTPSLIFDEIDQGIGGRVGAVVGRKLWSLTRNHQVLCVTHLPQLAAYGDQHLRVAKMVVDGRTITEVQPLEGAARVAELAVMLGGENQPNLESAIGLLDRAAEEKGAVRAGTA